MESREMLKGLLLYGRCSVESREMLKGLLLYGR